MSAELAAATVALADQLDAQLEALHGLEEASLRTPGPDAWWVAHIRAAGYHTSHAVQSLRECAAGAH